jgi:nucleoside-diphosphate-sugar epimerase
MTHYGGPHVPEAGVLTRVGLTGATGVLGRRIRRRLEHKGADVRCFAADLTDANSVERFAEGLDVIIHAAAVVPVQAVERDPGRTIAVNVGGSALVARAAEKHGAHLVYVSSSHVYEPAAYPLPEVSPCRPSSRYGITKLQGESWTLNYAPGALILRCFSFFDAWQPDTYLVGGLKKRIAQASHHEVLSLRGGGSTRDFADATFIATIVTDLSLGRHTGIVNCGTGRPTTVLELANLAAEVAGRPDVTFELTTSLPQNESCVVADTTVLASLLGELPPFDLRKALSRALRT